MVLSLAAAQCAVILAPTSLVRAPAHDSAVIRSDRLGGNFAYSVHEGHAYAAVSPLVEQVATPVAVSYHNPAAPLTAVAAHPLSYSAAPLPGPAVHVRRVQPALHSPLSYAHHLIA